MLDVFRAIYDAYGPDRLMWGSDYPVVHRFMTYPQSLEIVRSLCRFIPGHEMPAILGGTLERLLARPGAA
jgi:predicted TIM-barrel fold metal-dependent hydrolase